MKPETLLGAFTATIRRDFTVACRRRGEVMHPILFFIVGVTLFPLALTPDPIFLAAIAPAVLWVMALFAMLLALPTVFAGDYEDGHLAQLLISPHPPTVLILAKLIVHWCITAVPLILLAPLLSEMLFLPRDALPALLASLLLGTPALCMVGGIGAALSVATRRGGGLLAVLVLPLYVPILIFGTATVRAAAAGLDGSASLLLLAAFSLFAIALAPLAMVAALRASV